MLRPDGSLAATGYAGGDAGTRPDGVNNPALQHVPRVGPLPAGAYMMGEPVEHTQLGPFALPLEPFADNRMHGRSGFYCHGDNFALNRSASDGCIIMPHDVRAEMWESEDHQLVVV